MRFLGWSVFSHLVAHIADRLNEFPGKQLLIWKGNNAIREDENDKNDDNDQEMMTMTMTKMMLVLVVMFKKRCLARCKR